VAIIAPDFCDRTSQTAKSWDTLVRAIEDLELPVCGPRCKLRLAPISASRDKVFRISHPGIQGVDYHEEGTANGIAEVPLTDLAGDSFREQIRIAGLGPWLFPSAENPTSHQKTLETVWHATLRRAKDRICGSTICGRRTRLASARVAWRNETTDEKGGAAKDRPEGERKPDGF
jgi:hypothetical protein